MLLGITALLVILPYNKPLESILLLLMFSFLGVSAGLLLLLSAAFTVLLYRVMVGRLHAFAIRFKGTTPRRMAILTPRRNPMWDLWMDG